jgi:thiamine-phosphate diphosphorylase
VSGLPRPSIYLVTDRRRLDASARTAREEVTALERWLEDAYGRVDVIQIRERDLDGNVLCELAGRAVARARGTGTRVLVNDRADVARAVGADGVHLRADGPAVERVRTLGPPGWIVGRSVHAADEAVRHGTADYLIFGTVFPGGSKAVATAGLSMLTAVVAATTVPVIAIGGIDPPRATLAVRAGAAGVAGIGIFLPEGRAPLALGIARAADALREAMRRHEPEGKRQE